MAQDWTLLDESGGTAVEFTSFVDIDVRSEGEALQYPVEEGSFANYNKITNPLEIRLTLSAQGDDSDFESMLTQLEDYRAEATILQVSTPSFLYESMTLESFSYKRQRNSGATVLTVQLDLVEVREVEAQTTTVSTGSSTAGTSSAKSSSANTASTASAKNPTSTDTKDTGKTQTTANKSKLKKMIEGNKEEG